MPAPPLLLLLLAAPVVGSDWTLSTNHLAVTFGDRGFVSAVTDKATSRNLVLPAGSGGAAAAPQHSLISAVYVNATGKAASSPTKVVYDEASQIITASFSNGAIVPVSVNISDDLIVLTLEAAGAHVAELTDVLFLTIPVQIEFCAAGPTAVFDATFALLLLPGSLQTVVGTVYNEAWGSPMDPAYCDVLLEWALFSTVFYCKSGHFNRYSQHCTFNGHISPEFPLECRRNGELSMKMMIFYLKTTI